MVATIRNAEIIQLSLLMVSFGLMIHLQYEQFVIKQDEVPDPLIFTLSQSMIVMGMIGFLIGVYRNTQQIIPILTTAVGTAVLVYSLYQRAQSVLYDDVLPTSSPFIVVFVFLVLPLFVMSGDPIQLSSLFVVLVLLYSVLSNTHNEITDSLLYGFISILSIYMGREYVMNLPLRK